MQLFTLLIGKSKKKLRPHMTDKISAINFYLQSRNASGKEGRIDSGWFKVEPAPAGSTVWRKKSATIGGNKPVSVPHINRHGETVRSGYISKHGFQEHT